MILKELIKSCCHTMITFGLVLGSGSLAIADDTEIYFSGATATGGGSNDANVMFILDTSNSMNATLPTGGTRLSALKEGLKQVVDNLNGVNIALMRFRNNAGGTVLFPFSDVSGNAADVVGEQTPETNGIADLQNTNITQMGIDINSPYETITIPSSDAIIDRYVQKVAPVTAASLSEGGPSDPVAFIADENNNGVVERKFSETLLDPKLNLGSNHIVGVIWEDINVPKNARIIDAKIREVAWDINTWYNSGINSFNTTIYGIDSDNPKSGYRHPINGSPWRGGNSRDISSQDKTDGQHSNNPNITFGSGAVDWNITDPFSNETPSLTEIVQEIVSRGCDEPNNPANSTGCTYAGDRMGFVLMHNGSLNMQISRGSTMELLIEWEPLPANNNNPGDPITALHFPDIPIPQGAIITDAKLILTPSAINRRGDGEIPYPTNFEITAEAAGNSDTLETTDGDLSNTRRPRTAASVTWNIAPDEWQQFYDQSNQNHVSNWSYTQELSVQDLLQEVVNQNDYCGGNNVTFFIKGNQYEYEHSFSSVTNQNTHRVDINGTTYPDLTAPALEGFEPEGHRVQIDYRPIRLEYTYEPSQNNNTCSVANTSLQVSSSQFDAEQDTNGNTRGGQFYPSGQDLDPSLNLGGSGIRYTALSFNQIRVPKGSVIQSAELGFYAKSNSSTTAASFKIRGVMLGASTTPNFFSRQGGVSTYLNSTLGPAVDWNPTAWTANTWYNTSDISSIVQMFIDHNNWDPNNTYMTFILEANPGSGERVAQSYEGNPNHAARLSIRYSIRQSQALPNTVRGRVHRIIDLMFPLNARADATPIQPTMAEAARYWRGESMKYGDSRGNSFNVIGGRYSRVSHPGSYCIDNLGTDCNGAKVNANLGAAENNRMSDAYGAYAPLAAIGTVNLGPCDMAFDPNGQECKNRRIEHLDPNNKTRYISPFLPNNTTCGGNYQVLLTDGKPNDTGRGTSQTDLTPDAPEIKNMIGKSSCYANNSSFKTSGDRNLSYDQYSECLVDMVEYMATTDQDTNLAGDQVVKTHTIAYDVQDQDAVQFLKDIANKGQGIFYTVNSAADLSDTFDDILSYARTGTASIATPALAVNAFNRLLSRDEVYFGMFAPAVSRSWRGNVKKYNLCVDSTAGCSLGDILDTSGNSVIDNQTNQFRDNAQSIWSSIEDGNAVVQGGAGAEITDYANQILYTDSNANGFAATGTSLEQSGFKLTSSNWNNAELSNLRGGVCPTVTTASGSDCENRMLWLLGKKIVSDPDSDVNSNQRWSVNDVLHSSPVAITYGGTDTNNDGDIDVYYDKVVYGTNDGTLHFVNGETGEEEWRFLPSDFWAQQQDLYLNPTGDHPYGLDITPAIWSVDNNKNGQIETADNDKVNLFMAARRGGSHIYALDITADINTTNDTVQPKFMWHIQGGAGDYARLGQTWSQPQITTILVGDGQNSVAVKDVLIFGGGYDELLDNENIYAVADNNGIDFMGNALFITDPEDGSVIMSISGNNSGADIEIPDMHWSIPSRIRFMDSNGDGYTDRLYFGDTGGQVWRVDLLVPSSPGGISPAAGTITGIVGKLADVSGPNTTQQRRFFEPPSVLQVKDKTYSLTSEYDYVLIGSGYRPHPLNKDIEDQFYAFRDFVIDTNGMTDRNGDNLADNYPTYDNITSDLTDVTASALAPNPASTSGGWYYNFTEAGEKALSAPITTAGTLAFTTFTPSANLAPPTDPCNTKPDTGTAKAYNFNVLSADAALDWNGDGQIDITDRERAVGSGIPSDVVPIFTNEGVIAIVGVDGSTTNIGQFTQGELPRFRTYWYEEL